MENVATTGRLEGKRDRGRPIEMVLNSLYRKVLVVQGKGKDRHNNQHHMARTLSRKYVEIHVLMGYIFQASEPR